MTFHVNYSVLDRFVHRIAFLSPVIQKTAADIENTLFRKQFAHIEVTQPVFITSLPRAGTTLLLEAIHPLPGFATNLYRDMPFIAAPLIWNRLSAGHRKNSELKERAHGDGVSVGYDSPEAFEEVIWKSFWPDKYQATRIEQCTADDSGKEFQRALVQFMQKIIIVRLGDKSAGGRYVSKNNVNIGRIGYLKKLFPNSVILVPFRDPLDHAASMRHQHEIFLKQHEQEPFIKQYMADIGHYEFGQLHRLIAFDGIDDVARSHQPDSLEYWIGYWSVAFNAIADYESEISLICYERACEDGASCMQAIGSRLQVESKSELETAGEMFRPARRYDLKDQVKDESLLERAYDLHQRLLKISIN